MRILWVDHMQIRLYGNQKMGPGVKLFAGALRNNYRILDFSERDITRFLAPLGIRSIGAKICNKKLIKTAKNFKPDLLFIGHCDYIRNETLIEIRRLLPHIRMAHINIDPLWMDWHIRQIKERMPVTDAVFVTSGGPKLRNFCTGKNVVSFIPNPTDPAYEQADCSRKTDFKRDLLFCGKELPNDFRNDFLKDLQCKLEGKLRFDIFGMFGNPPIWGADYERALHETKMSINLNREETWPLYSSDRIAQLMASGILTFQSDKGNFQKFFSDREIVYYSDSNDLVEKILYCHTHDDERRAIAAAGRTKYRKLFSGERTIKFMVETLTNTPYSEDYEWADEVYR